MTAGLVFCGAILCLGQGIPAAASRANWTAHSKMLKIFFGTSRKMKERLVACWGKKSVAAAVRLCLPVWFQALCAAEIFIPARLLGKFDSRMGRISL